MVMLKRQHKKRSIEGTSGTTTTQAMPHTSIMQSDISIGNGEIVADAIIEGHGKSEGSHADVSDEAGIQEATSEGDATTEDRVANRKTKEIYADEDTISVDHAVSEVESSDTDDRCSQNAKPGELTIHCEGKALSLDDPAFAVSAYSDARVVKLEAAFTDFSGSSSRDAVLQQLMAELPRLRDLETLAMNFSSSLLFPEATDEFVTSLTSLASSPMTTLRLALAGNALGPHGVRAVALGIARQAV
jgi:hypothetical protein